MTNRAEMMDTLVTTKWLNQHLDDPDLVLLDCSVYQAPEDNGGFHNVSGRAKYDDGHIPSAGFADLKGKLCDANSPIEFAVPTPEQFCTAMGALGVGDNSRVVLYDINYTAWAARVWWMLGYDELAAIVGGDRNARPINYCGGGIMASANAFIMTRLGFINVAVYTASLQEWAVDPSNRMVVNTP